MSETTAVDPDEAAQLAAIALGDAGAFADWLRAAEPRVRASLLRFSAHVDVEAVVQETLLRAWQVAPRVRLDGKGESLLRLSIRMARNLAVDEARRLRAAPLPPEWPEQHEDPIPVSPPDPFLRAHIAGCRERLPKKPRLVLDARLSARGGEGDLVQTLGMRRNTFLQNLARARKLLLACLEELGISIEEVME